MVEVDRLLDAFKTINDRLVAIDCAFPMLTVSRCGPEWDVARAQLVEDLEAAQSAMEESFTD